MTPPGAPMITRPSELDHEKTLNQARQFIEIMGDIGRAKIEQLIAAFEADE